MALAEPDPMRPPRGPRPVPSGVARPAVVARLRARHLGLWLGFVLLVVLPTLVTGGYLGLVAADQYGASAAFALRSEKSAGLSPLLAGFGSLAGASNSDAAMVAAYLQSPALVTRLDQAIGLRAMFARRSRGDPVFGFDPAGSREDLVAYWNRMVSVSYDAGTGLIALEVRAFSAGDAQKIAQAAFDAASGMINRLSATAQQDATRAARQELHLAAIRLTKARAALQAFRERSGVLEPGLAVSGRMGIIGALQRQAAAQLVTLGLLRRTTGPKDPRIAEAERRLTVIRAEIAAREQGDARAGQGGKGYARLMAEYDRLTTEQAFAEKTYLAAQTALDAAQAAARSRSYYLAAYQRPMRADSAQYPRRLLLTGLVALFAFLIWSVLALIYYSLRDRR